MVYVDDILIFTETFEQHLEAIDKIFTRLERACLKIKLQKCEFARTQLHYLGHVINSKGIGTDPKKVEAINNWAPPANIKELEQFLGTVNYYSKFIKEYSSTAAPLFQLKKKKTIWEFTEERQQAFEKLKKALCEAPVLRHPDMTREFSLTTDASGWGLGATLSQVFQDDEEHPVSCASRTLKEEETRYPPIDREALGVVWAVTYYEEYLSYNHFTVFTDHKPLITLMTKSEPAKRLIDFAMKLADFTFTLKYKPGKVNWDANALSRLRTLYPVIPLKTLKTKVAQTNESQSNDFDPEATLSESKRLTREAATRNKKATSKPALASSPIRSSPETITIVAPDNQISIASATALKARNIQYLKEDPFFAPIIANLQDKKPFPTEGQYSRFYQVTRGRFAFYPKYGLYFYNHGKVLECVPERLRQLYIYENQDLGTIAHGGVTATMKRITTRYFWPSMLEDVRSYLDHCALCKAFKMPNRNARHPLGNPPPARRAWERLHIDVWSPGAEDPEGYKYVVAFVDAYTKYAVAEVTMDHTAQTIAGTLLEKVVAIYGPPEIIVSDGAPELVGNITRELYKALGITRKVVSPYHP